MNPRRLVSAAVIAALAAALVYRSRHEAGSATKVAAPSGLRLPAPSSNGAERGAAPNTTLEPSAVPTSSSQRTSAASTLSQIRSALEQDPKRALALLDESERADAAGPDREARAELRVEALVRIGEIGLARDAAEGYLLSYPNGAYAQHLEALTGVHPHPAEAP